MLRVRTHVLRTPTLPRHGSTLTTITQTIGETLTTLQSLTHAPWWATLLGATLALRLSLSAPLSIASQTLSARAVNAAADVAAGAKDRMMAAAAESKRQNLPYEAFRDRLEADTRAAAASAEAAHSTWPKITLPRPGSDDPLVIPSHLFLPWVQIPFWVSMSLSLRSMAAFPALGLETPPAPVDGFVTGGIGSFVDLTAPDTAYILPLAVVVANLANIEFMEQTAPREATGAAKILSNGLRGLTVLAFPILLNMPSAITFYWASSASYGLLQSIALRQPSIRRLVGIPHSPIDDAPSLFSKRLAAFRATTNDATAATNDSNSNNK